MPLPELLDSSASYFKNAKAVLDRPLKTDGLLTDVQKADATAMVKVAIANAVLIASLSLRPPPEGSRALLGFGTHPHFVTVTLKPPA